MPHLCAEDSRVSYLDEGRGCPVVLVHGFADSKDLWRPQVRALAPRYRIIAPDLHGHGEAPAPDDPAAYRAACQLSDLRALFGALELDRAVLGGHSLGAYLALEFYRRWPERIAGLILLSAGPGFRNPAALARWNETITRRADRLLAQAADRQRRGELPIDPATGTSLYGLAHVTGVMMRDPAALDVLPAIRVPAVVVVGSEDAGYRRAGELLGRLIPDVETHILPGAGHRLGLERPDEVTRLLAGFLDRVTADRSIAERGP